jgi:hypothetical protein
MVTIVVKRPDQGNLLAWAPHMTIRRVFLLPAILLAVLLAACDSTAEALPRLDDPTEILEEALRTTAELEFVHARVEAAQEVASESQSYTLDGDLNLAQREFHAVVDLAGGMGMQQRAEILLVGTDIFTRTQDPTAGGAPDDRWQRIPIDAGSDPRNGIPATPAIAVALRALLSDPGLTAKLEGMEACGDRQCYHVTLTIAPDLTWRAVNGALIGAPPGGELGPVDPAVPEITLDVLVDEATRQLVSLSTSVEVQGQSIDLTATLSDHGVEFDLIPPPPEQVVDANVGGGTGATPAPMAPGVILDEVGGELEPAPTPP